MPETEEERLMREAAQAQIEREIRERNERAEALAPYLRSGDDPQPPWAR